MGWHNDMHAIVDAMEWLEAEILERVPHARVDARHVGCCEDSIYGSISIVTRENASNPKQTKRAMLTGVESKWKVEAYESKRFKSFECSSREEALACTVAALVGLGKQRQEEGDLR